MQEAKGRQSTEKQEHRTSSTVLDVVEDTYRSHRAYGIDCGLFRPYHLLSESKGEKNHGTVLARRRVLSIIDTATDVLGYISLMNRQKRTPNNLKHDGIVSLVRYILEGGLWKWPSMANMSVASGTESLR